MGTRLADPPPLGVNEKLVNNFCGKLCGKRPAVSAKSC